MEADVIKWLWANLPTLSVAIILARVYVVIARRMEKQDRRCAEHSATIKRLKRAMIDEHPERTREILEGNDDETED